MKDGNRTKYAKNWANRRVRHSKAFKTGKSVSYKRVFNSWDISDYNSYFTREAAIKAWKAEEDICKLHGCCISEYGWHKTYGTLDNFLNKCWAKHIRK